MPHAQVSAAMVLVRASKPEAYAYTDAYTAGVMDQSLSTWE